MLTFGAMVSPVSCPGWVWHCWIHLFGSKHTLVLQHWALPRTRLAGSDLTNLKEALFPL